MARRDRQLTANLRLSEFPGWEQATEAQVRELEETAARVLQPIRTAFGVPLYPTSWIVWSSGEPRTGTHAHGGTVDFILGDGRTKEAHEWGERYLLPAGYIGRWIYEPARTGEGAQGEHIHMAPRSAQIAHQGRDRGSAIQSLVELEEGVYELHYQAAPIALGALALLGGLVWALARRNPQLAI